MLLRVRYSLGATWTPAEYSAVHATSLRIVGLLRHEARRRRDEVPPSGVLLMLARFGVWRERS